MANDFYVHIVESPSPNELLDGITEGRALREFLDIAGIQYSYNLAVDLDHFHLAMTGKVEEAIRFYNRFPILHLSTHGGEQGIQLTNQYGTNGSISWSKLADYLRAIHEYINGGLGVCMSCCGGAHGIQMAKVIPKENIPYRWIAGSFSKIDLRDATLAYAILYRRLHRGIENTDHLKSALRVVSDISDFDIWYAEQIQEQYKQELIEKLLQRRESMSIAQILERIRPRH